MTSVERDATIPRTILEQTAASLRVLAHPDRLRMVELLLRQQLPVGELAEAVGLSSSACSQHLTNMRAHGLLRSRREGRWVYYEVIDPAALSLLRCLRGQAVAPPNDEVIQEDGHARDPV